MNYIRFPKPHPRNSDRDRQIIENLGLVRMVINRLPSGLFQRAEFEDLFSEGTIGLAKAVDRFDPDLGNEFSTFAVPYIRGEILRYFERRWFRGGIKISRKLVFSESFSLPILELDRPVGMDGDETFLDTQMSSEPLIDRADDAIWVDSMLERLQIGERRVIESVYFQGKTQKEAAEEIGVNHQTAWRYHKSGMKKLKKLVERS